MERKRLATVWLGFADVVRRDSKLFVDLGPCRIERLQPLCLDRAPATLRRHLSGWRAWLLFCASAAWPACRPSLSQMLDFLASLAQGSITNRRRRETSLRVLSALMFGAYRSQLEQLQSVLDSPLVTAWQNSAKWTRQRVKEALPLSLVVLFRFEQEDRLGFYHLVALPSTLLCAAPGRQCHMSIEVRELWQRFAS